MEELIGKMLKNDIINAYGVTILPALSVINEDSLKLLNNHKIDMDSISFIRTIRQKEAAESKALVQKTIATSKGIFESIKGSYKIPLMEIRKEVLPSIKDISINTNIYQLFEMVKAKDDYTYEHNIGVAVLSTLIGRWMKLSESELSILSLSALMHDVGKVKTPEEILNKPDKLTNDEFELIKKHTIYGYELLKETLGINHRIALVSLQHHEREDGMGYPFGLKKEKIDSFSSIVAVADIFHAMSSKRPYHDPISFHEIIDQMGQGKFGKLNPHVISIFLSNMMRRLVGNQVVLTDGRIGEVVYLNPNYINAPLIKVDELFIDLQYETGLHIKDIIP
ncbi:MAG: HD-GYP domain-containing protein [Gorillibacterium sp.]|nr:HD-GYP domain-containing protein [Gorillibacterium sp.]